MSGVISLDSFHQLTQQSCDGDDRVVQRDGSLCQDRQITLPSEGFGARSVERQQNREAREAFHLALNTHHERDIARFLLPVDNTPLTSRMVKKALETPGRAMIEQSQKLGAQCGLPPEDSVFLQLYQSKLNEVREHLVARLDEKGIKLSDDAMKNLLKPLGRELNRMMALTAASAFGNPRGSLQDACETFTMKPQGTFPGLDEMIETRCAFFEENVAQMIDRFTDDRTAIQTAIFSGKDIGELTGVSITDSDPHHGGQQVCILTFSSGEKLVYKPRDCRVDALVTGDHDSFASVLNAAAKKAGEGTDERPLLPTYKYYAPGKDFGFVQYLPHGEKDRTIKSEDDIANYYKDMGSLTGLAWLAGVSDLHHGNVLCSNRRPHLTDLEIAFNPQMPSVAEADLYTAASGATMLSMALERNSGTGMIQLQYIDGKLALTPYFQVTDHLLIRDGGEVMEWGLEQEQREGFKAVLDHAGKEEVQEQLLELCRKAATDGYRVRRHPIETGTQSEWLDGLYTTSSSSRADAVGHFVSEETQIQDLEHLAGYFTLSYRVGDIPYFTADVRTGAHTYIGAGATGEQALPIQEEPPHGVTAARIRSLAIQEEPLHEAAADEE